MSSLEFQSSQRNEKETIMTIVERFILSFRIDVFFVLGQQSNR